jgi:carboxymethylenebutenolidase
MNSEAKAGQGHVVTDIRNRTRFASMIRLTGAIALVFTLLFHLNAAAFESTLTAATVDGPVSIKVFSAPGQALRPTVLVLHGREGIVPFDAYARYAAALAAAGIDAWLFSYYGGSDDEVMHSSGHTRRAELFRSRFRAWTKVVSDIADFALAQRTSSGQIGLLGFSNGGFLGVGTAATNRRIGALVVLYGGIPGPVRDEILGLPPLLALHGDNDKVIPIAEGQALVDRAVSLGGWAELIPYPGADHGFDFIAGSPAADDARSRVVDFLRRRLVNSPEK